MSSPAISRSLFNRLRYKHLHMLVALSSSQNLHRASQSLNMSQPAATRMLREIEDMFACDLFERLPRGMRPTALGKELIRFAESALSGLDRCAEELMMRQQGGYGYLSIGTIMGAAPDQNPQPADAHSHHGRYQRPGDPVAGARPHRPGHRPAQRRHRQ
jgi:DNA-binding transcriptional LysR family regulator